MHSSCALLALRGTAKHICGGLALGALVRLDLDLVVRLPPLGLGLRLLLLLRPLLFLALAVLLAVLSRELPKQSKTETLLLTEVQ